MCFPGLEFYRVESASKKYFRFHLALVVSEEAMILNANWFGLELPFRLLSVLAGTPVLADGVCV